jgi:hypothetical protein
MRRLSRRSGEVKLALRAAIHRVFGSNQECGGPTLP